MNTTSEKSVYYWLLALQALPAVLLLFLTWPYSYLDWYAGTLITFQLFISCSTMPMIEKFSDYSFRIWCCGALIIPLPLIIFLVRLLNDSFIFSGYYIFLISFFILNYINRKSVLFAPMVVMSLFGSMIIWGSTELFSDIYNDYFWGSSPTMTFFQEGEKAISQSLVIMFLISIPSTILTLTSKFFYKKALS